MYSLRSSRDREGITFPLCSWNAVGVTAVDFDGDVVPDTSLFSVGGFKDLTEEPGEGYSEARKRFDMSRALVDGFVSLQ